MKVLNEFPKHHYIEEYERVDLFCPHCGQQKVWEEQSRGDYYCGPNYLCESCGSAFTLQGPDLPNEPRMFKQIEQLRTGVTLEATTPKGN